MATKTKQEIEDIRTMDINIQLAGPHIKVDFKFDGSIRQMDALITSLSQFSSNLQECIDGF